MRYVFIGLLLILTLQKLDLRNILKSNAWNLNALGYFVWLIFNLMLELVPNILHNYVWLEYVLRLLGFFLLIAGAYTLRRDLKDLRKHR